MDFNEFMRRFAEEIDGKFSEYDDKKSVVIVPLERHRFQTVTGVMKYSERYGRHGVEFSSKVCPYEPDLDLRQFMEANNRFCHIKFVIVDGYVKVDASAFIEDMEEASLKEAIVEVARTADEWEYKITGKDEF